MKREMSTEHREPSRPVRGLVGPIDLLKIWDTVASGVVDELDFRKEARNAAAFEKSLSFLGYATTPQVLTQFNL